MTSPQGGIASQSIDQSELFAEHCVDGPDYVGNHRSRGVEDASLHPLPRVRLLKEEFIEVDDRILLGIPVSKISDHGLQVGLVQ